MSQHSVMTRLVQSWLAGVASVALVASCQAPPMTVTAPAVAAPQMAIDAGRVLDLLAEKPNNNWQDGMFTMPALQERKKAHRYQVKATAGSSAGVTLPGAAVSSSAPAYMHTSRYYAGPAPEAADALFVVTDAGTLYKLNATTLATITSRSGLGSFSQGAVLLSSDNRDVYLLTTTGQLLILDSGTLATRSTVNLSGLGFGKTAPYIDYATSAVGNGAHDDLYAVANDGTINRVVIDTATGTGAKTAWAAVTIPYGTLGAVNAFPVVWNRRAYFGNTTGTLFAVDLSGGSPTVQSWDLSGYTSASGAALAITAPVAIDFDAGMAVNAVFVPCGDRLIWVNPLANTVTPSVSLTVDAATRPVVAPRTSLYAGSKASYVPASILPKSYNSTDYVSIKRQNTSPSRWGGTLGSVFNTGTQGTSVKYSPNGGSGAGEMWVANYAANTISRLNMSGGNIANIPTANGPNEVAVDSAGNCWVACTGGGRLQRYSPTGVRTADIAVTNATWPEVDSAGNPWVTTNNSNTLARFTSPGFAATFPAKAVTRAMPLAVDAAGNAWTASYTGNRVYCYTPTGALRGAPFPATGVAVGTNPAYVSIDPVSGDIWVANRTSRTISVINKTTFAVTTLPTTLPANLWAVNFDSAGVPWTSHLSSGLVNEIDRVTGAVVTPYTLSGVTDCYETCIDPLGNAWVGTDVGIIRILNLGNLTDMFGATYNTVVGDNDDSYGFVKFKIPLNDFAGFVPVSSSLSLTANSTTTGDNFSIYQANVHHTGGALWTAYTGVTAPVPVPNVDWNNRPVVGTRVYNDPALSVAAAPSAAMAFTIPGVQSDKKNSLDLLNSQYAFALQSAAKPLGQVLHWCTNTSALGVATRIPKLQVSLANTAKLPTTVGITAQPSVGLNNKVYVMSCNALFELDYSSVGAFMDPAKTLYNMSETGRAYGPIVSSTTPKTYIFPKGNVLLTENGRAIAPDFDFGANTLRLNNYLVPLNPNVDRLNYQVVAAPAAAAQPAPNAAPAVPVGATLGQAMLYDFQGGRVYLTASNGRVVRVNIMQ